MNATLTNLPYALSFLMVLIGIYCIISYRDLIKIICGFSISGYGVNILFAQISFVKGGSAPVPPLGVSIVDPLLQALVLTAIVIEFGLMMYMLAVAIKIYRKTGDMDVGLLRRLRG